MSPSNPPSRTCYLSATMIGLGAVLAVLLASNSLAWVPPHQIEPLKERLIQNVRAVQANELYGSPNYTALGKLSDEMQTVLFEGKHVEQESLRGIYITAETAASKNFPKLVDTLIASGGNTIVMDVQLSGGLLAFVPEDEYVASINPGSTKLANLKAMIGALHHKDVTVIARLSVFSDPYTAAKKSEWRVKYKNGRLFSTQWLDPSNPDVQNYKLAITREVAKLGFDELQYDYIRFPDHYQNKLDYFYDETKKQRWEIIRDYLKEAKKITDEYGIKLGMDVFGATIWGDVDWDLVGQYIPEDAKVVDVIYPMTYPSHVAPGYNGFKNPYGDPYTFVKASIEKFIKASDGHAEIRTWIQGFPLRIPHFGPWFVKAQIHATYDAGANAFVVWSPGNNYSNSWSSLSLEPPKQK